jgi:hypothetical protein
MSSSKAIVCFGPSENRVLQKLFKQDFQHCFVVLYADKHPVVIDPTVDKIDVLVEAQMFSRPWKEAVEVEIGNDEFTIFGLHTCVGHVKRVIGLNKWWIITPYQLYKELNRGSI